MRGQWKRTHLLYCHMTLCKSSLFPPSLSFLIWKMGLTTALDDKMRFICRESGEEVLSKVTLRLSEGAPPAPAQGSTHALQ